MINVLAPGHRSERPIKTPNALDRWVIFPFFFVFALSFVIANNLTFPYKNIATEQYNQAYFHFEICVSFVSFLFFLSLSYHYIGVDLFGIFNRRMANNFFQDCCSFCKNNGEPEMVYKSHNLRDDRMRVQCPRLREYKCKRCGALGDNAHTIRYCPLPQCSFPAKSVYSRQRDWYRWLVIFFLLLDHDSIVYFNIWLFSHLVTSIRFQAIIQWMV